MTTVSKSPRSGVLRGLSIALLWLALVLMTVWAAAALYVDVRTPSLRLPLTAFYVAGAIAALVLTSWRRAVAAWAAGFVIVLAWWLTLKPSNEGPWNPNLDRTAWAGVSGDAITIHNLRNCEYRTEDEYHNCWSDRTLHLSKLQAMDFTLTTWGPKFIGHPIMTFDFGGEGHVAFSIEVRYRPGQSYSALLGFFRQFTLIFVAADERDVLRLRTNYRQGENVFLYRTALTPELARKVFLTYIGYLNQLHERPEWYNALTRNCTTALNQQIATDMPDPRGFSIQLVFNGTLDELLYSRGRLVTGGLPFPALKAQALVNTAAKAADSFPDFSARIRAGRVGF